MNEYDFLTGNIPEDAVSAQLELAKALKKKQNLATLAQLTGDKVLAPYGANLSTQQDRYAREISDQRQKNIDNKQTKAYQDAQIQYMQDNMAQDQSLADMADKTKRRGQDLDYQSQLAATMGRINNRATPRLTGQDKKNLEGMSGDISAISDLEDFIKTGKGFGAVEVGGVPVPGARSLKNALASYGFGSDDDKRSFKAKQDFDRLYTLAARNRLYGATLTPNEQKAWDEANPAIRQTDAQIKDALGSMKKVLGAKFEATKGALVAEGYSPEAVESYAGIQRGKETPKADDSDLTAEEKAELAALKKELGIQ